MNAQDVDFVITSERFRFRPTLWEMQKVNYNREGRSAERCPFCVYQKWSFFLMITEKYEGFDDWMLTEKKIENH